jgi:hypothetical protein
MKTALRSVLVVALGSLLGCSDPAPATPADGGVAADTGAAADVPAAARAECNPLGFPEVCMQPFPSAYYQAADGQLALPAAAMPVSTGRTSNGSEPVPLNPAAWNRLDGFSPGGALSVYFPQRIDPATLVSHTDLAASLAATGSTALVDMTSGQRVLHFAEVDVTAREGRSQSLIIRPMVRLIPGHRYAVAITSAVRAVGGGALTVPPGFAAILAGDTARDPRLARVAPRYTDIFAALERAGVPRSSLTLAWDYTTATDRWLTAPVLGMRDAAMTMVGERGLGFTVTQVEEDFNVNILRRITGTIRVPSFIEGADDNARLSRGADGAPRFVRVVDVPFVAMVPRSAMTRGPLPLIQFGHGLLGSAVGELGGAMDTGNYVQHFINEQGFVVIATNWTGLSFPDVTTAIHALSDFNYLPAISDQLQQSLVNAMVLYRTGRAQFGEHAAFQVNGRAAFDPARAYYFGISLGGIMGTAFMGYSPDCRRGVLNVPGANWGLLLQRSSNFALYSLAFNDYENPAEQQVLFNLAQSLFDPADPLNVAPHLLADRLPGVPEKSLLFQEAVNDASVNNLSTELLARAANVPLLVPAPRMPYGLSTTMGPAPSALTIWDEHPTPAPSGTNQPASSNPTHGTARAIPALVRQIATFLTPDGQVTQTCDGPCDPQ